MRVLVVEDETLSALALTSQLEDSGCKVIGPACSSGEAMLLARNQRPGVALVDIDLESEGSGIRLARQLCEELNLPVIFMTDDKATAHDNANFAIGVLLKPFDYASIPDVLRYVGSYLRKGSPLAPASHSSAFELFEANGPAKNARSQAPGK